MRAEMNLGDGILMKKTFNLVNSLWVSVDFADVMAGRAQPPWVNHDQVNFNALAELLSEAFQYGPPVRIRVPNDTIDQATVHARMGMIPLSPGEKAGSPLLEDFGDALLRASHAGTDAVIDVRKLWSPFHYLKNRVKAPPPMVFPFVIEADDFEDAAISAASMLPSIGLPMPPFFGEDEHARLERQGTPGELPRPLRKGLEALFGCKFEKTAFLNRLASDPAPIA
jgi:hypothetical protein